ncbi:MAG: hypothetical protein J5I81_12520 [Nitrococcus mobilis]|nr:hypothetical protein [Nitrococcus mobilis]
MIYKEKPAYGVTKRFRRRLLSVFNLWNREGYDVRYVYINKKRYKKVIFHSESKTNRVHGDLTAFGPSLHFPAVIGQHRNTVWVEFVQGPAIRSVDTGNLTRLADFYAAVYRRRHRLVALCDTIEGHDFYRDLEFLHDTELLSDRLYRDLVDHRDEIVPAMVWVGFDYTDPITANLVLRKDTNVICAIDIKNLYSETLIGRGIAKARSRWLSDGLTEPFFEQLLAKGAPDFQGYLPFLEVLYQVRRTKTMVLQGQIKSLRPAELNQRLEGSIQQARAASRRQQARCSAEPHSKQGNPSRMGTAAGQPAHRL